MISNLAPGFVPPLPAGPPPPPRALVASNGVKSLLGVIAGDGPAGHGSANPAPSILVSSVVPTTASAPRAWLSAIKPPRPLRRKLTGASLAGLQVSPSASSFARDGDASTLNSTSQTPAPAPSPRRQLAPLSFNATSQLPRPSLSVSTSTAAAAANAADARRHAASQQPFAPAPPPPLSRLTGFSNLGNTCFANAVLQALRHCSLFVASLDTATCQLRRVTPLAHALVRLLADARVLDAHAAGGSGASRESLVLRPVAFQHAMAITGQMFQVGAQHDAQEFLRFLLGHVEECQAEVAPAHDTSGESHPKSTAGADTAFVANVAPVHAMPSTASGLTPCKRASLAPPSAALAGVLPRTLNGSLGPPTNTNHKPVFGVFNMGGRKAQKTTSTMSPGQERGPRRGHLVRHLSSGDSCNDSEVAEDTDGSYGQYSDASYISQQRGVSKTVFVRTARKRIVNFSSDESDYHSDTSRDANRYGEDRDMFSDNDHGMNDSDNGSNGVDAAASSDRDIYNVACAPPPRCSPVVQQSRKLCTPPPLVPRAVDSSLAMVGSVQIVAAAQPLCSPVTSLWYGRMQYTTTCLQCETRSSRTEVFSDLTLPVADTLYGRSLSSCLSSFTKGQDKLSGANKYQCAECRTHTEATRSISLVTLPPLLTVHLNRSRADGGGKVRTQVQVPFSMSLEAWTVAECAGRSRVYDLVAIVYHAGHAATAGHYICAARSDVTASWHVFDDAHVTTTTAAALHHLMSPGLSPAATPYLLFFHQRALPS